MHVYHNPIDELGVNDSATDHVRRISAAVRYGESSPITKMSRLSRQTHLLRSTLHKQIYHNPIDEFDLTHTSSFDGYAGWFDYANYVGGEFSGGGGE